MSEPSPDKIPLDFLGEGVHADLSRLTVVHHRLTEESTFADECWEKCDPETVENEIAHRAGAEFCMRNALAGGRGGEYIIDITAICRGPKRRILGGKVCGIEASLSVVDLPFDETHPQQTAAEDKPEQED